MQQKIIGPQVDAEALRTMLATSGTGVWDWYVDTDTAYYSDEWLGILGEPSGAFKPNINFRNERIHPEDLEHVLSEMNRFLRDKAKAPYVDFRIRRSDGAWAQVRETMGITGRDENGVPNRLTGMMRDNTAAKLREKRLEKEVGYLRYSAELAGLAYWEWDVVNDRMKIFPNKETAGEDSLKPFEDSFMNLKKVIHPEDSDVFYNGFFAYLERGEDTYECALRILNAKGEYQWRMCCCAITDHDVFGKATWVMGGLLNIDENIRAKHAMRAALDESELRRDLLRVQAEQEENTWKALFGASPYISVLFDEKFNLLDANPFAVEYFGVEDLSDLKANYRKYVAQLVPPFQPDGKPSKSLDDRFVTALKLGSCEFVTELVQGEKSSPTSVLIKKIDYRGGSAFVLYAKDLTQDRELRASLQLRDRLLSAVNDIATMLVSAEGDIAILLENAMRLLCEAADADRSYIFRNSTMDGRLRATTVCTWIKDTHHRLHMPPNTPYDDILPGWEEDLAKNKVRNRSVAGCFRTGLPVLDRLDAALNIPLFANSEFWGTIGLARCSNRLFTEVEESILRSAGTLFLSVILRDEMTKALIAANEAAMAGSQAKTDFLSRMSHEIRSPINAVIGMTTLARKANDMPRIQYCLNKIEDSSRQLLSIINDVLDMSKIEANKLEILPREFEFDDLLQRVINVVQVKMEQKCQTFHVGLEQVFTRALIGDDLRLSQVLINLLDNAAKFTPDLGRIAVRISQKPVDEEQVRIHVEVSDSGIGVTEEQKSRLFGAFEQAEGGTARRYGGTGLGLSIARSIVQLMGGDIWVEDNPGGGLCFLFEVVLKWGGKLRAERSRHGLPKDLRVLIVDDESDTLDYMRSMLERYTQLCDTVLSGREAVDLARQRSEEESPYDLIFLDWRMPEMDGGQTARELIRITNGRTIIVMISSALWSEIGPTLAPLGVTNYLPKPILPSSLYNTIVSLTKQEEDGGGESTTLPAYDWSRRRLLLVEDMEINREIVLGILEDTGMKVDCAEHGRRALELFAANRYDLVLMDIQMPVMDGYDATRAIRALDTPQARICPIIAMTAHAFNDDVRACIEAGMNGHLAKPIDVKLLFAVIDESLNQSGGKKGTQA